MKKLILILVAFVMLFVSVGACAATALNGSTASTSGDDLDDVTPFKFEHNKNGIGKGTCPVYSAPYTDAYRCANGKACVDTNHYVDVGGFNEQGWLMVRYSYGKNDGSSRVGWIPPKYVSGVKTPMTPHFSYVEQYAPTELIVTDNCLDPHDTNGHFAKLSAGEQFYVVGRYNYYNYDLWYIEFWIDDQPARGFIEVSDLY